MSLHQTFKTQTIAQPYMTPVVTEVLLGVTKDGLLAITRAKGFMEENSFIDHVFIKNSGAPLFSFVVDDKFKGEISKATLGIQHGSLVLKLVESTTDTVIFCDFGSLFPIGQ